MHLRRFSKRPSGSAGISGRLRRDKACLQNRHRSVPGVLTVATKHGASIISRSTSTHVAAGFSSRQGRTVSKWRGVGRWQLLCRSVSHEWSACCVSIVRTSQSKNTWVSPGSCMKYRATVSRCSPTHTVIAPRHILKTSSSVSSSPR